MDGRGEQCMVAGSKNEEEVEEEEENDTPESESDTTGSEVNQETSRIETGTQAMASRREREKRSGREP
eukprot:575544-Hanusia_phi.AAC.1